MGFLAVSATVVAATWPFLGYFLLLATLPLWLLFIVHLVRRLRP